MNFYFLFPILDQLIPQENRVTTILGSVGLAYLLV